MSIASEIERIGDNIAAAYSAAAEQGAEIPEARNSENLANTIRSIDTSNMELLWQNASPNSAFGEQTVNVDLSGYDAVIISYEMSAPATVCVPIKNTIPAGGYVWTTPRKDGFWYSANVLVNQQSMRVTLVYADKIIFADGARVTFSANNNPPNYTFDNTMLIPYQIYGVK